ncbi:MAG: DUF4864 domain-containing protein [Bacillota bacterium]
MKKLFATTLLLFPGFALAQVPLAARDADEVKAVVEAQLDAFRHDDAARAFAYAAPDIQKTFGTPERFIEMVKSAYAVVYRPHNVSFEAPAAIDGEVFQPVRMTDAEGHAWIAIYPMTRVDGRWRINGCQLGRVAAQEV